MIGALLLGEAFTLIQLAGFALALVALAWTYLSPPALLEPGERTGTYRRGQDTLLTDATGASRISAEELAVAVLDELERPTDAAWLTVAY